LQNKFTPPSILEREAPLFLEKERASLAVVVGEGRLPPPLVLWVLVSLPPFRGVEVLSPRCRSGGVCLFFFLVFSLWWQESFSVEGVGGVWLILACWRWSSVALRSHGRILVARSTILRRLLMDTRLLALFVVSLRCFSHFSRPCGFTMVGAWASCASAFFLIWARVRATNRMFFAVYGGAGGDRRLFGVWGLKGCSGAGACVTRAATDGGSRKTESPLSSPVFDLVVGFSNSLHCACTNSVIGFCPVCVTDSLFK
jgi:hypothetical protein